VLCRQEQIWEPIDRNENWDYFRNWVTNKPTIHLLFSVTMPFKAAKAKAKKADVKLHNIKALSPYRTVNSSSPLYTS
jgi:hypothetical protein